MRILMAAMSLGIGGAETHVLELARELKRRGHDVFVASAGGVFVKDLAGITHFTVPLARKKDFFKAYKLLKRIIKENSIDIVHAHARIPAFVCGLLKRRLNFPFVTTAHWVFRCGPVLNLLTNWGDKTFAVSDDIKKYLVENYSVSDITVTINGIDTERFSPETVPACINEFGFDSASVKIVYVSRLDDDRSEVAFWLLSIANRLDGEITALEIIIVGDGNSFAQIKEEAEKVNEIAGRRLVTLAGARSDIYNFTSCAHLFIGVSRSALEALATGCPTIVAGNEGYLGLFNPELKDTAIEGNFCCRNSGRGDSAKLLEDILDFFKIGAAEIAAMRAYNRSFVMENYSVRRMGDDAELVYNSFNIKRNRILISGYYGFMNSGDDALLKAMVGGLKRQDLDVTVLSNNPSETAVAYGVGAIDRVNVFSIIEKLKTADVLISGGGSLMQDVTSQKSLIYYLTVIWLAKRLGTKTMLYANGIGPLMRKSSERRVRNVLNGAELITLRDEASLKYLKSIGVDKPRMELTADPAFLLDDDYVNEVKDLDIPDRYFLVSIRPWCTLVNYEAVAAAADTVSREFGCMPVFLPMQRKKDSDISSKVAELMEEKSIIIGGHLTIGQILSLIKRAHMVIGMRLHTLIFAASMATPFIALKYDPKISGCMEYIGVPDEIDVADISVDLLMAHIRRVFENRDGIKEHLKKESARMNALARKNNVLLAELLKS